MGVDYDAEFGLGYEIKEPKWENKYDAIDEYFDTVLKDSNFQYFHTGCDLTDEDPTYYIVSSETLSENTDLKAIKMDLDNLLKANKIKSVGKFGLVGGLHVW